MITDVPSGTTIQEIEEGIYRISVPVPETDFAYNQFLVVDEEPLLFHTGLRAHFPLVSEAIRRVMPLERLRYVAFSHFESDECGALNHFLGAAPSAVPVASRVAVLTSLTDFAERPPRALNDGEQLSLGRRTVQWLDTPHLPHGWETGYLFDESTRTLFCGDLFTQPGRGDVPLTEADILAPSESFRAQMDYYSATRNTASLIAKLAATRPTTLAVMHGSAWSGDGSALLMALNEALHK